MNVEMNDDAGGNEQIMRVIVKYKKDESATYISHLDVQRSMQRALKRSGLPIKYTSGFHPHIVLTFAQPLPVGVSSLGDYMEFSLTDYIEPSRIKADLNSAMAPGFYVVDCGYIRDGFKSLMSLVDVCDWIVQIDDKSVKNIDSNIEKLHNSREIFVDKHTKKGYRRVDIKPGIIDIELVDRTEKLVHMKLQSGGTINVSPKMALFALGYDPRYVHICRKEIYYQRNGKTYPLINISK